MGENRQRRLLQTNISIDSHSERANNERDENPGNNSEPNIKNTGSNKTNTTRTKYIGSNETNTTTTKNTGSNKTNITETKYIGANEKNTTTTKNTGSNKTNTTRTKYIGSNETNTTTTKNTGSNKTNITETKYIGANEKNTFETKSTGSNKTHTTETRNHFMCNLSREEIVETRKIRRKLKRENARVEKERKREQDVVEERRRQNRSYKVKLVHHEDIEIIEKNQSEFKYKQGNTTGNQAELILSNAHFPPLCENSCVKYIQPSSPELYKRGVDCLIGEETFSLHERDFPHLTQSSVVNVGATASADVKHIRRTHSEDSVSLEGGLRNSSRHSMHDLALKVMHRDNIMRGMANRSNNDDCCVKHRERAESTKMIDHKRSGRSQNFKNSIESLANLTFEVLNLVTAVQESHGGAEHHAKSTALTSSGQGMNRKRNSVRHSKRSSYCINLYQAAKIQEHKLVARSKQKKKYNLQANINSSLAGNPLDSSRPLKINKGKHYLRHNVARRNKKRTTRRKRIIRNYRKLRTKLELNETFSDLNENLEHTLAFKGVNLERKDCNSENRVSILPENQISNEFLTKEFLERVERHVCQHLYFNCDSEKRIFLFEFFTNKKKRNKLWDKMRECIESVNRSRNQETKTSIESGKHLRKETGPEIMTDRFQCVDKTRGNNMENALERHLTNFEILGDSTKESHLDSIVVVDSQNQGKYNALQRSDWDDSLQTLILDQSGIFFKSSSKEAVKEAGQNETQHEIESDTKAREEKCLPFTISSKENISSAHKITKMNTFLTSDGINLDDSSNSPVRYKDVPNDNHCLNTSIASDLKTRPTEPQIDNVSNPTTDGNVRKRQGRNKQRRKLDSKLTDEEPDKTNRNLDVAYSGLHKSNCCHNKPIIALDNTTRDLDKSNVRLDLLDIIDVVTKEEDFGLLHTAKQQIHSRSFRTYCNQMCSTQLRKLSIEFLKKIVNLQESQFKSNLSKARSHRRYLVGFNEIKKHLPVMNKVKVLFVAPDLERVPVSGGIDDEVQNLLTIATIQGVPYLFSVPRRKLGHLTFKSSLISCLAVLDFSGAESMFEQLLPLISQARLNYEEKLKEVMNSTLDGC